MRKESQAVIDRYSRRTRTYSHLDPAVYMSRQELERALIRWLSLVNISPGDDLRILEVGCGSGANLLQFLRFGFAPDCLTGNELQPALAEAARQRLPNAVTILDGDALDIDAPDGAFDIVFQSLVFSSLLDDKFQSDLAEKMWRLTKPGGWIVSYDFVYDNPTNKDVRGVPRSRIRELFPKGELKQKRITLAPPISRLVTRVSPRLYTLFNALPFLRTHCLCWIAKS